jgi:hypothetical protein
MLRGERTGTLRAQSRHPSPLEMVERRKAARQRNRHFTRPAVALISLIMSVESPFRHVPATVTRSLCKIEKRLFIASNNEAVIILFPRGGPADPIIPVIILIGRARARARALVVQFPPRSDSVIPSEFNMSVGLPSRAREAQECEKHNVRSELSAQ